MACIGCCQYTCGKFEDTHPYCHKHLFPVVGANGSIGIFQGLRRRFAQLRSVCQDDLGDCHKHGRGNAFSGHIRNDQAQVVVIDEEKSETPANLFGRIHAGINIKFFRSGKGGRSWKHGFLNAEGQAVRTDPFLLCRNSQIF